MRKAVLTQCYPGLKGFGDGVCRQEFKKMCAMEEILRAFRVTGVLPNVRGLASLPCDSYLYGDYTNDVANVICSEVNKDESQMVHGDSDPAEGSSKDSAPVAKEVEGGVKGESPVADA